MLRPLIVFILFFCFLSPLVAQQNKIINYFKHLELKDGLPENDVKDFLVDGQNSYWFRTASAIVHYSGHEFVSYQKGKEVFGISNAQIQAFVLYNEKVYVFGDAGVDEIDCRTKQSRNIFIDSTTLEIKSGYVTTTGKILIISKDGAIYVLLNNKLTKLANIEPVAFFSIIETDHGEILVSNNRRQLVVLSKELRFIKTINLTSDKVFGGGMYKTKDYGTIVIIPEKAYRFNYDSLSLDPIDFPYEFKRLLCISKRYFYIVSNYNTIKQYDRRTGLYTMLTLSLNKNYYINKIGVDHEGTLILSTNQGIILYQEPHSGFFNLPNSVEDPAYTVTAHRALVETPERKIIQVHYKGIDLFDPVSSLNKQLVKDNFFGYAAIQVGDMLWVGTDGLGLHHYNFTTRIFNNTSFESDLKKGKALHITAINKLNERYLLLGTTASKSTLKIYDIKKDVYNDVYLKGWQDTTLRDKVSAIVDDSLGGKWICTINGLLYVSDSFEVKKYLGIEHLKTKEVNNIYIDDKHNLWIASDKGVLKYDLKTDRIISRFTVDNGMAGNKCIALLSDAYSTLWIPTYTGLSRIEMQSNRIVNYYMKDGLTDDEYNYSAYLKTTGGDIYLGGLNGYVRIIPFPFDDKTEFTSSINIDYALIHKKQGVSLLDLSSQPVVRLHRDDEQVSLCFSTKNYLSSEYVRYYYRIDGLHEDWIQLGRQNKIELSFLPPGNYTLNIQSRGADNQLVSNDLIIPVKVFTYWYESKILYALLMLLIIFSIAGIFYARYNTVKSIGKIRTDLANDIHDEIGTMLTKAIMRLELLRKKKEVDPAVISPVEDHLRDTVLSFRNVLWSLNTDNNKTEDFVGRLNTLLQEIFDQTQFEFIITNLSPNIYFKKSINIKRNLLLIVKELANNALKYSNGNLFEVVISSDGKNWKILIVDNGSNTSEDIQQSGVGLSSIQKRVDSMKGKLNITKKEKGFYVTVYL